jgi:hypothetical protein
MTAFDAFQLATCLIAEGRRVEAATALARAIRQIDADGVDRDMRADLLAMRDLALLGSVAA